MSATVQLYAGPLDGLLMAVPGDAPPSVLHFPAPISAGEVDRRLLQPADPAASGTVTLAEVVYERPRERAASSVWRYVYRETP